MLPFADDPKTAASRKLNAITSRNARERGMNASQTGGEIPHEEMRRQYREKWRADNKAAIAAYTERVNRDGAFGDDVRSF